MTHNWKIKKQNFFRLHKAKISRQINDIRDTGLDRQRESCVPIWEKHYPGHRDLACQQTRSRYTGKLFISYERNVTFHIIFVTRRDLARKLVEKFSR